MHKKNLVFFLFFFFFCLSQMSSSLLRTTFDQFYDVYNQYIVPRLTKRNKSIAISTAIAVSLYFYLESFKPPKKLRHIPYQHYFSSLKAALRGETFIQQTEEFRLPLINSPGNNGIYMVTNALSFFFFWLTINCA